MARAVVAGGGERESEREREEKVSRSSSQEQEQSSRPKHPSPFASVPLLWPPTILGSPSWPPSRGFRVCMYSCRCAHSPLRPVHLGNFDENQIPSAPVTRPRGSLRTCRREKRARSRERRERSGDAIGIGNVDDGIFSPSGF